MNDSRNMSLLTELENLFSIGFYKDVAPTALADLSRDVAMDFLATD
ncbi:MAG TPA: hypothetical protein VHY30_03975 [Verrucomicrobiae bacterium]|nr:hypothetical protein [Verrucomicrobiae bacterium]